MAEDFVLTGAQRHAWASLLTTFSPRGARTRIAAALAAARQGDLAGWKTRMTGFFSGEAKDLKAILPNKLRREVVEKALGASPGTLLSLLARARGHQEDSDPFHIRVPGFEDRGPIPADRCPILPPLGSWGARMASARDGSSSSRVGGWTEHLVQQVQRRDLDTNHVVSLIGAIGSGRTLLLRMAGAALRAAGLRVGFWEHGEGDGGDLEVLLCDDVDRRTAEERERVFDFVRGAGVGRVVIATSEAALRPSGARPSTFSIGLCNAWWATTICSRFESFAREAWDLTVDLAHLQAWITSDPLAGRWIDSPAALGIIVRYVVDGGVVPPNYPRLFQGALDHAARRLSLTGDDESASVLRYVGSRAFPRIAEGLVKNPRTTVQMVARILAEEASAIGGRLDAAWVSFAHRGMIQVVEALRRARIIAGEDDALRLSSPALLDAGLGLALIDGGTVDDQLLRVIARRRELYPALVAAAQAIEDLRLLIAALFAMDEASTSELPAVFATLLATGVPCTDRRGLRRAYCVALWWYLQAPPPLMSVRYSADAPPERSPTGALLVHPYLLLAEAGRNHPSLRARLEVDELLAFADVPLPLQCYARLLGFKPPDGAELRRRLGLLLPHQNSPEEFLDAWAGVQPDQAPNLRTANFTDQDASLWWRRHAAPALTSSSIGRRTLLGLCGGPLLDAVLQNQQGAEIWGGALSGELAIDASGALPAWQCALSFGLRYPSPAIDAALARIWEEVPEASRATLRGPTIAALRQAIESDHFVDGSPLATWILRNVATPRVLRDLWIRWTEHRKVIPWEAFLERGLPDDLLAHWVADRSTLGTPQEDESLKPIVDTLLARGELGAIEVLIRRSWSLHYMSCEALSNRKDPRARALRFELIRDGISLLDRGILENSYPGEIGQWRRLARSRWSFSDMLRWSLALDLLAETDQWRLTILGLKTLLAALYTPADAAIPYRRWMQALGRRAFAPLITTRSTLEETLRTVLVHLSQTLMEAHIAGRPPRRVVAFLVEHPRLVQSAGGGMQGGLWALVGEYHGPEALADLMDDPAAEFASLQPRPLAVGARPEWMRILLGRPRLRLALGLYLSGGGVSIPVDFLVSYCEMVPIRPWSEGSAQLVSVLIGRHGASGIALLERRLAEESAPLRQAWWSDLVPRLPEGPWRAEALTRYFEARRH